MSDGITDCERASKELQQKTAKLYLKLVPTDDLIAELEKRRGVESVIIECDDGPAKSLVVHNWMTRI